MNVLTTLTNSLSTIYDYFQRFINLFPEPWIGIAVAAASVFIIGMMII